ncbi:MAG: sigma-54-dependent Fis family transcriptional regulator [Desulfobacteraceae bacterium]|nr:sigma-54-dependent Fis family transcriptional regulator [Desulfobacteraceae bacterium]
MPLALQVKLLRFIQEGTIERVGGTQSVKPDVRIIAATNVELENAVKEGQFREDLYYRLNVVPLITPPLRERQEDILFLAHHFIREEAWRLKRSKVTLSQVAASALTVYSWPGNVRELQNAVRRAMTINTDGIIKPSDLGLTEFQECDIGQKIFTIREARYDAERQAIQRALAATGNNITQAAKLLGITRPTLHDLLKKLGMEKLIA